MPGMTFYLPQFDGYTSSNYLLPGVLVDEGDSNRYIMFKSLSQITCLNESREQGRSYGNPKGPLAVNAVCMLPDFPAHI